MHRDNEKESKKTYSREILELLDTFDKLYYPSKSEWQYGYKDGQFCMLTTLMPVETAKNYRESFIQNLFLFANPYNVEFNFMQDDIKADIKAAFEKALIVGVSSSKQKESGGVHTKYEVGIHSNQHSSGLNLKLRIDLDTHKLYINLAAYAVAAEKLNDWKNRNRRVQSFSY